MKRKRGKPKQTSVGLRKQKPTPKSKLVQEAAAKDTVSSNGVSLNSQEKLALDDLVRACGVELESQNGTTRSRPQQISQKQREVNGTIGDSVRSFHEPTVAVSADFSKQAGGAKTGSSRGLASCNMESNFNGDLLLYGGNHLKQQKRTRSIMSKSPRGYYCSSADRGHDADLAPNGSTRQEESYVPYKDSVYKEQELTASLNHQQQDGILPSHKKLHQTPSPCDQQHNPEQGTLADKVNSSPLNPRCGQLPLSPEPTSPETDIAENTYSPPAEEPMRRRTRSSTRPSVATGDFAGCHEKNYSTPTQQENCQDPLDAAVANGDSSSSKKGRRPTQFHGLWKMKGKITIATNDLGQPVGPDTTKLTYFLGTIGRNGHLAPLNYVQWRAVPDENKEKMWQLVQAKFDMDPKSYAWVMKSIGNRWKNWKCLLKVARYNTHDTDEERLADIDERVIPEQWHILVKYWNSEESQKRSSISKANRAHLKFQHATGAKSYARVLEEERAKQPDGKEPTKADFFIRTRTRKDGKPVNDETSKVISQLREKAAEHQGTTEVSTIEDDVFFEVMGEENPRRLRALGLRPAPSDIIRVLRSGEEAIKIAVEASTEVREMKEKIMSIEQTCAQMASQMATMMSMMSTMHEKLPDKNLSTETVSPPEPQQAVAAAEVSGGSVRSQKEQARVGRKRKMNKAIAKA